MVLLVSSLKPLLLTDVALMFITPDEDCTMVVLEVVWANRPFPALATAVMFNVPVPACSMLVVPFMTIPRMPLLVLVVVPDMFIEPLPI